mgnify:CR=1 FL=1
MKIDLNTILIIAGFAILVLFNQSEPKVITVTETEIRTEVLKHKADSLRNVIYKVDLSYLEDRIDSLMKRRVNTRDTLIIIKTQDKIIYNQSELIDTLNIGILNRDTLNYILKDVILSKDTTIQDKNTEITKNKKRIKNLGKALKTSFVVLGGFIVKEIITR